MVLITVTPFSLHFKHHIIQSFDFSLNYHLYLCFDIIFYIRLMILFSFSSEDLVRHQGGVSKSKNKFFDSTTPTTSAPIINKLLSDANKRNNSYDNN